MTVILTVIPMWLLVGFPTFHDLRRAWDARRIAPASGTHFTILVADLAHDESRDQTRMLGDLLQGQEGLEVVLIGRALELPDVGSVRQARTLAEQEGQQLLRRYNGDVLIWGTDTGKTLQLRFLARGGQGSAAEGMTRFGDSLEVPRRLTEAVGAQVMAAALSMISPLDDESGRYLVQILMPVAAKLRRLAADTTNILPLDRGPLLYGLAGVTLTLGEQTGRAEYLRESAAAYQLLVTALTRENRATERAHVQIGYGLALLRLSDRDTADVHLRHAIAELRQAQATFSQVQSPDPWGSATLHLGIGTMLAGQRERGTRTLARSVATYRDALNVFSREQSPAAWGIVQNNLALSLYGIGLREPGTARLREALEALERALQVRARDREPLYWATSMNNRGVVLTELGRRTSDPVLLEQAISTLRQSLEVRTRDRVPEQWATTQINLGVALAHAGALTGNTAGLREAAALHVEVLQAIRPDRSLLQWLRARGCQGTALMHLGEHEPGTGRLEDAEAALREAVAIDWRGADPIDWFTRQATLGRTLVQLGARGQDDARLREGIALLDAALPMLPPDISRDHEPHLTRARRLLASRSAARR